MTASKTGGASGRELRSAAHYVQQGAIGFAGGLLGAFAMNVFARAVNSIKNGREAEGAAPGDDRVGRGVQPPQSERTADQDAAVRAGTIAYRVLADDEPSAAMRPWLGAAAHYAFSGMAGVCYAVIAGRSPAIGAGYGTVYGTAVWAIADEGITPALGLSRGPRQLPLGVHLYALGGHAVYGATLESVRRLLNGDRQAGTRSSRGSSGMTLVPAARRHET